MTRLNFSQNKARREVRPHGRDRGFTLVEILVALALVTALTLMMFQSIAPWLNLRQKIETERRLEQVQSALTTAYRLNAMRIESSTGASIVIPYGGTNYHVGPSEITGTGDERRCSNNSEAARALSPYMTDDWRRSFADGARLPFCMFMTNRLSASRDGVTLYYRVAAIVAVGNDGVLGATTGLASNGVLNIDEDSDDIGVLVNGLNIQRELYEETRQRVERVAELYGSYFTARYLSNPARDYSIDYFVASAAETYYDGAAAGSGPAPTEGTWHPVATHLADALGLGPNELVSVYESDNTIDVANQALSGGLVSGVQVQDPAAKSMALPPYTALLRTRLPGPATNYLLRVVPGNY